MNSTEDYLSIFANNTPLLDIRAPVEFKRGAFPNTVNFPLMTDEERTKVGICYKKAGQKAAIELGHQLVCGDIKQARIEQWRHFFTQQPNGLLYCFRGGLRSSIVQQWLADAGVEITRIAGGYKAMRRYLLDQLLERIHHGELLVLCGAAGSGKTDVINRYAHSIDLERLAGHRGSAFGSLATPQPSQISFENAWSIEWLKCSMQSSKPTLFEDESRLIGRIALRPEFQSRLLNGSYVVLDIPAQERVKRIRQAYFQHRYQQALKRGESEALKDLQTYIEEALKNIQKRLGGVRHQSLLALAQQAILLLKNQSRWSGFDPIIELLLRDYYDPMYRYQLNQKTGNRLFQGNQTEVLQWLNQG